MKKILFLCTTLLLLLFATFSHKKSGSVDDTNTYEVRDASGTWSSDYFDYYTQIVIN